MSTGLGSRNTKCSLVGNRPGQARGVSGLRELAQGYFFNSLRHASPDPCQAIKKGKENEFTELSIFVSYVSTLTPREHRQRACLACLRLRVPSVLRKHSSAQTGVVVKYVSHCS